MDKLAERAGLYDLWVTFFPGLVGVMGALLWFGSLQGVRGGVLTASQPLAYFPSEISDWAVAVVASFFEGLVLQEVGRWIRYRFGPKDASCELLDSEKGILSAEEISDFRKAYASVWPREESCTNVTMNSKSLFHRINASAQECEVAKRYAKLSIIQHMSASLAAAMLLEAIAFIGLLIYAILRAYPRGIALSAFTIIASFALVILFRRRSERFNRYWVRSILFAMAARNRELGESRDENSESR